jgi:hypothetical protein
MSDNHYEKSEWKLRSSQELVAHAANPSHLGGRDQEDRDLRPGQAKSETLSRKYST